MTPPNLDPSIQRDALRRLMEDYAGQTAEIPTGVEERVLSILTQRIAAGDLGPDLPPRASAASEGMPSGASTSSAGSSVLAAARVSVPLWRRVAVILGLVGVAALGVLRPWEERTRSTVDARERPNAGFPGLQRRPDAMPVATPMQTTSPSDDAGGTVESSHRGDVSTATLSPALQRDAGVISTLDPLSPAGAVEDTDAPVQAAAATGRATSPRKKPVPPEEVGDVDVLAAELALVSKARLAIKSGRDTQALAALDEHAASFPQGALAAERDLSRVQVLCRLGDSKRAASIGAALRKRAAESVWAKRLEDTCVGSAR